MKNKALEDITFEIDQVTQLIEDAESLGLDSQEYENKLTALFATLSTKLDRMDYVLDAMDVKEAELKSLCDAYEQKVKEYKKKMNTVSNSRKRILDKFLITGLVSEEKKLKTTFRTYYLKKSYSVAKENDDIIPPEEYSETMVKEKLKEINKALKQGEEIPGYYLKETKTVIRR